MLFIQRLFIESPLCGRLDFHQWEQNNKHDKIIMLKKTKTLLAFMFQLGDTDRKIDHKQTNKQMNESAILKNKTEWYARD